MPTDLNVHKLLPFKSYRRPTMGRCGCVGRRVRCAEGVEEGGGEGEGGEGGRVYSALWTLCVPGSDPRDEPLPCRLISLPQWRQIPLHVDCWPLIGRLGLVL